MSTTTILATFDGEVLRPDEPLAIAANTRVRITIEAASATEAQPKSFLEVAQSLNLDGPADWSERVDDYLYGPQADADD